jgi:hypothetical protein
MKKTLITAVALAACATQLLAQNAKEDVISFNLTLQQQKSVSTSSSKTVLNQGNWSQAPRYYLTMSKKLTQADVIKDIAIVLHGNPGYYSSRSQLVMVQAELSGFIVVGEDLAAATGSPQPSFDTFTPTLSATSVDSISVPLATGRNYATNKLDGRWAPGHHQPWGQIYVKDPVNARCENVTFFFAIKVAECYDCYYLNSFISDASFSYSGGGSAIPPCCFTAVNLNGSGTDRYYMTFSFDNTINNPYLNPLTNAGNAAFYVGDAGGPWPGIIGRTPNLHSSFKNPGILDTTSQDGVTPDFFQYQDPIAFQVGQIDPYALRFSFSGIVTYKWSMKFINNNDPARNFIGTASSTVAGTAYERLICGYVSGPFSISERVVKASSCCLGLNWYDWWYGIGYDTLGNSVPRSTDDRFTPVNLPVDLSYHAYINTDDVPWQQANPGLINVDGPTGFINPTTP